jgi:prefoldin subunit 5
MNNETREGMREIFGQENNFFEEQKRRREHRHAMRIILEEKLMKLREERARCAQLPPSESASVWLHSLDTDIENTEKEMRTVSYEGANEYVERTALSPSDLKIMNIRPDYRTELQARQSELRLQIEALQEDTHILNQEISVIERTIQDLKSERGKIEQESERGSEVSQKMLAGYDEVIAAWVNSANSEHQKLWKTVESLRQCAESLRSLELELSPLTAMRTV